MKKGQVGVEFIFTIGIIILIFLVMYAFTINRNTELERSRVELNKENTCLLVSSLITSAFVNGENIMIDVDVDNNFTINLTHLDKDYKNLNVEDVKCLLGVNNVESVSIKSGLIRIQSQNNTISVENV